ncbi:MAG: hypothetical protein K0R38_790 [Polyangiaceae bacterium]|jgi:hypothetical protein|nr:hypothetical protein [Polyangiaceae bacterium]
MTASIPHFLLERERDRNESTRGGYSAYAAHRARQMALMGDRRGERLAVLGAGNCNDLELSTLAASFRELHLFDLDEEALDGAWRRQNDDVKRACHLHTCDLTGVASFLEAWKAAPPEPLEAQLAAWTKLSAVATACGQFDTVLSSCLLSQVAINLRDYFGIVPALNSALVAAISGHVMLAAALTKPGAAVLVTSDCITSRYPIREEAQARGALNAILHLAAQGAAFPGTDPELVASLLTSAEFSRPELKDAWIWDVGSQSYLVYALEAVRHA